jgi:BirA family biotin operon repressor/biotin-[acetyl-CoA-carboxylase] ligase
MEYMVIGIGVNVNSSLQNWPTSLCNSAISVSLATGKQTSSPKLLSVLLYELEKEYDTYMREGFQQLRRRWETHSGILGKEVTARVPNGLIYGKALCLIEQGDLILQTESGQQPIYSPCIHLHE